MKTELELRHLRVFLTVVEAGAHARAARKLGISQSTVSETLSALERALGTALFHKTSKGSTLTPSGEALLPYARRALALTSELVTELARVSADVCATLVVSAVESVSTYVLPSRLAALRAHWPNARIEVTMSACAEIRASVAAGRSHLGLVLESDARADDEMTLAKARLVVCASPAHRFAHKAPSAGQLAACDFYMSDAAGDYHQLLRQHFDAAGIPAPRIQALGTIEGVKRGILAGGTSLGLLPAHAVEQELRAATLAEVRMNPPLPGLALRAVLPAGERASPMVDELIRRLRGSPLTADSSAPPPA